MRAGAPGPGVPVIADNRGVKVLVDKGVILCGCVLLALLAGEVDAVAVIWLLLAVATSGLSMATDRWRWVVAVPAGYLLLGTLATASVAGAPLNPDYEQCHSAKERVRSLLLGFRPAGPVL